MRSRLLAGAPAVSLALGLLAAASPAGATLRAAAAPPAVTAAVTPTQAWTDTGVTLTAGDTVTIEASGLVDFGRAPIDEVAPAGLAWGPQCGTLAGRGAVFVAPGLNCYSLIGRIGTGKPFAIGARASVSAVEDGALSLGTNDNNLGDNTGAWSARVTVQPAPAAAASVPTGEPTAGGSNATVAILAGLSIVAVLAFALLVVRKRGSRDPAFDLPATLQVGRIDVRVGRDRSLWSVDSEGVQHPFLPFASDFAPLGMEGRHTTFTWRGLDLRAVRSRVRFGRPNGEVSVRGEYVSASAGMTLEPNGYTQGLLPLSLAGAWVFTLVSVDTGAASDRPSTDGHLTMFIRADEPFAPQADALVASFRAFLDDLDRLLAEREASGAVATEQKVTAGVE